LIQLWGTSQKSTTVEFWDITFPITFSTIFCALINTLEENNTYANINYWYEFKNLNNSGCTIYQAWMFGKCYYLIMGI